MDAKSNDVPKKRMPPLDITPIMNRELMTATRKIRLWGNRWFFAGMMLAIVLVTFAARYYWDAGDVSDHDMMARVALQAFLWILMAHAALIFDVFSTRAAPSIAGEKDRGTLDFLLATRLSNAEIVLGKLASCMTVLVAGCRRRPADHAALAPAGGHRPAADLAGLRRPDHHGVLHDRAGRSGSRPARPIAGRPARPRSSGRWPG